ncbi:TIGR01777 family oxidoreductase [Synechococcus sp. M16CYN]|uniref:TIGR01777 family oxidoreductase n=1 Tax=Synechococcus sp. M16CYN TaxID=3103139 RepID=UPI003341E91F
MHLLLLGCTGFIGYELVPILLQAGHQLTLVSRKSARGYELERSNGQIDWLQLDPAISSSWQNPQLTRALSQAEGVINLVGEPITGRRWNASHLKILEDSRLETTRLLVEAIAISSSPPGVLINASAVGFYGTSTTTKFVESSPAGDDFLASLCQRWEAAATAVPGSVRQVIIRIGIVLASGGGALGKMLPAFSAGFGGPIGSGRQWMSWIHRSDLCVLIQKAIEDSAWSGVVNAVAPEPVSMAVLAKELGLSLNRPSFLPVPGLILRFLLGDGAKVVLEGQRVASERLGQLGFSFRHSTLTSALAAVTSGRSHSNRQT